MKTRIVTTCLVAVLAITTTAQAEVVIEMVTVGDPGNTATMMVGSGEWHWPDAPAGAVADVFRIAKYEVTAGQYTEFLNAKATTDDTSLLLYNGQMGTDPDLSVNGNVGDPVYGCKINRSGVSGSYTYTAVAPDLPVNYVSWGDAARFTNWMHNGQGSGDIEAGVYELNGANTTAALKPVYIAGRAADATIFLPNLDEWVKAAHYDPALNGGAGGYYVVPTTSDIYPAARVPVAGANTANIDVALIQGNTDALLDVGTFFNTTSPYGAFDMTGNVNEWIGDTYIRSDWGFNSLAMGNAFAQPPGAHNPWAAKSGGLEGQNNFRRGFRLAAPGADVGIPGDFDEDGDIDSSDIGLLCANFTGSGNPANDPKYDLDGDGDTDQADMDMLIHDLVEITGGDGTGTEYGDFDLDGDIDTTDLTILATNFGVGTTWAQGNANCDLVIDTTDLAIMATNFGFVASGAVPEPATLFVMGCGAIGLLRRPRSKIRRGRRA